MTAPAVDLGGAIRLVEDAWEEVRRSPFVQQTLGIAPNRLPDLSFAEPGRSTRTDCRTTSRSPFGWFATEP